VVARSKTVHSLCACGCNERTRTNSAQYVPGHAPSKVKIQDAAGLVVELTDISEEPPAYAQIGTIHDQGIIIRFTVLNHPTCGNFTWEYPRDKELLRQTDIRRHR
jgi:expansin (peptidoglycan-binding protein)